MSRTICLGLIFATLGSLLPGTLPVAALPSRLLLISQMTEQDYVRRGRELYRQKDFTGAIASFNKAIQISHYATATLYQDRGEARRELEDYEGANADFTEAIRLDRMTSYWQYFYRGSVRILQKDYQGALSDANQSIQNNPQFCDAYVLGAAARIGLNDYQKAQKDLDQSAKLCENKTGNDKAYFYYWSGFLQLKLGNKQQAIADYEEAVRLDSNEFTKKKAYTNYSLIARRQLETPVAIQQSRPIPAAVSSVTTAANTPAPNVYKIADQTTVLIQGSGSGVIISKVGNTYYVLTANHVVANQAQQQIVSPDGSKKYSLDYTHVKKVKNLDLAVVQFTSNETYPIAQLGSSENLSQGDIILVSGWPAVAQAITKASLQVTDGRISGFQKGDADGYEMLYTNATAPGMSGGPIFDSRGRVVGIHGRAAGNTNSGKVGINLGIPIHLFLQQAPQAGLNLQQLGLRAEK